MPCAIYVLMDAFVLRLSSSGNASLQHGGTHCNNMSPRSHAYPAGDCCGFQSIHTELQAMRSLIFTGWYGKPILCPHYRLSLTNKAMQSHTLHPNPSEASQEVGE
jgi:hypothetical protein